MGIDHEDSYEKRASTQTEHIERLQALHDAGRLVLAGPHPAIDSEETGKAGCTGSLIVAEFDSLQHAKKWADADPYVTAMVYKKVLVKPFKQVF